METIASSATSSSGGKDRCLTHSALRPSRRGLAALSSKHQFVRLLLSLDRVKVRIVKRPTGTIDGMALKKYRAGEVYDVSSALADYLILEGFARPEMRTTNRAVKLRKRIDRRV